AVERDERAEDRNAADEVLRAVDRIDDPATLRVTARAEFFADDAVVRALAFEHLADGALRRFVHLGHRRLVRLRAHGELRPEAAYGNGVGGVGERESEAKVVVHIVRDIRAGFDPSCANQPTRAATRSNSIW